MLLANDMADGLRRRLVVTGQAVRLAVRYSRDGEANVGAWTRRVRGPGRRPGLGRCSASLIIATMVPGRDRRASRPS
jgi:hypothetical protein